MNRREFITVLSGAAALPHVAGAQQATIPVIGILLATSPDTYENRLREVRQGLRDVGFIEGENVAIVYRSAEGHYDRLPALAADLVHRKVAVIFAAPIPAALAVKAATATTPIVFNVAGDPVKLGLVAGLARPGGNATGVNSFLAELGAKQLGLLRELLPTATRIGLLVNPANANVEDVTKDVMAAATTTGLQIDVGRASDSLEIEAALATLARNRVDAILVGSDVFFSSRRVQLSTLMMRYGLPAIFNMRDFPEVGGLMSYGTNLIETHRQVGIYVGRILKGANPAELPVIQSTKFEFVVNLVTARALRLEIPPALLARADEVIE